MSYSNTIISFAAHSFAWDSYCSELYAEQMGLSGLKHLLKYYPLQTFSSCWRSLSCYFQHQRRGLVLRTVTWVGSVNLEILDCDIWLWKIHNQFNLVCALSTNSGGGCRLPWGCHPQGTDHYAAAMIVVVREALASSLSRKGITWVLRDLKLLGVVPTILKFYYCVVQQFKGNFWTRVMYDYINNAKVDEKENTQVFQQLLKSRGFLS